MMQSHDRWCLAIQWAIRIKLNRHISPDIIVMWLKGESIVAGAASKQKAEEECRNKQTNNPQWWDTANLFHPSLCHGSCQSVFHLLMNWMVTRQEEQGWKVESVQAKEIPVNRFSITKYLINVIPQKRHPTFDIRHLTFNINVMQPPV